MSRWILSLFCVCVMALPLRGQTTEQEAATPFTDWFATAKTDLGTFPDRLLADTKATFFEKDNLALLGWAGLASVAMNNGDADDDVADHFAEHSTFGGVDEDALFVIGSPITHFIGTGLWYFLDTKSQDEPGRQKAVTLLSALTITATVTGGLKAIRNNDQPDGQGWSWPSGHTSSSVAVASVLHEFYGLKVGLPAYTVAGVVAWRMMDDGDHWASDVVFGAALGWVVGHTVAQRHGGLELAGFEVQPYSGNAYAPAVGLSLVRRF